MLPDECYRTKLVRNSRKTVGHELGFVNQVEVCLYLEFVSFEAIFCMPESKLCFQKNKLNKEPE